MRAIKTSHKTAHETVFDSSYTGCGAGLILAASGITNGVIIISQGKEALEKIVLANSACDSPKCNPYLLFSSKTRANSSK